MCATFLIALFKMLFAWSLVSTMQKKERTKRGKSKRIRKREQGRKK